MVQLPLNRCALCLVLACHLLAAAPKPKTAPAPATFGLEMDGGRRLVFEASFSTEKDLKPKRSLLTRLVDLVAGAPDMHFLVRPYGVATDSRGRILIADPGAMGIHIVDVARQKYQFLSRREAKEPLTNPQCVAIDREDNFYVTDPDAGKIFVFDANNKFRRTIGGLKGGEGIFKHPTGIAVDSAAQRIYVSDTWRNKIFVLDMQGSVLQTIGHRGHGDLEFNYPTELHLAGDNLIVVDSLNFRLQILSRDGAFLYSIGESADTAGRFFRPKGIAVDSEGHLYVADAFQHLVQVFDRQGRLLYYFGHTGTAPRPLQMPAGLAIDRDNRIFVVDSTTRSLLQFQYYGPAQPAVGGPR